LQHSVEAGWGAVPEKKETAVYAMILVYLAPWRKYLVFTDKPVAM